MSAPNDGGTAFPSIIQFDSQGRCANSRAEVFGGLSVRDYFAGQAIAGLMAFPGGDERSVRDWAQSAYAIADAMLLARAQEPKP